MASVIERKYTIQIAGPSKMGTKLLPKSSNIEMRNFSKRFFSKDLLSLTFMRPKNTKKNIHILFCLYIIQKHQYVQN